MRQAKRIGGALVAFMMVLSTVWPAASELGAQTGTGSSASGWPQRMAKNGHVVLVHAPQIDSWEQHAKVAFRAAVAVQPRGEAKPIYGVVDVTADTATDFDRRTVVATNIRRELRFPGASAEAEAGGARMSSDVQSQLDRDVASRGRSEHMSEPPGSRDFGDGAGRAASGGGGRGGRGRR